MWALCVNNGSIKKRIDLSGIRNRLLNSLNVFQRIASQGIETVFGEIVLPDLPIRTEVINWAKLHHIGKTLVKPEVIPPLHGHEITKPLMWEFMSNDCGDIFFGGFWSIFIRKKTRFAIGNKTPVFHSTSIKIRDSNLVQFGQRIWETKKLVIKIKRLHGDLIRKLETLFWLIECRIGCYFNAVLIFSRNFVKFTDTNSQKISWHLWRGLEGDDFTRNLCIKI